MEADAAPTYELMKQVSGLVVPPDSSNLRLYGAHTGPALTGTQDELVVNWLKKEFPEDTGQNSQAAALDALGACMSQEDFETSGAAAFPYQQTSDAGPCGACHKTGEAGTWLGFNADEMFDRNTKLPYIKRLVRAQFDGTTFVDLVPSTRLFDKPEFAAQCGDRHPQGIIDPPKRVAMEEYISLSIEAWHSGNCN
jgi:hypothetical protein